MNKKEKELQTRLKSPVFWIALVTQVLALLVATGLIGSDTSTTINNAVIAAFQLFGMLGIINNPTNKSGI